MKEMKKLNIFEIKMLHQNIACSLYKKRFWSIVDVFTQTFNRSIVIIIPIIFQQKKKRVVSLLFSI